MHQYQHHRIQDDRSRGDYIAICLVRATETAREGERIVQQHIQKHLQHQHNHDDAAYCPKGREVRVIDRAETQTKRQCHGTDPEECHHQLTHEISR